MSIVSYMKPHMSQQGSLEWFETHRCSLTGFNATEVPLLIIWSFISILLHLGTSCYLFLYTLLPCFILETYFVLNVT